MVNLGDADIGAKVVRSIQLKNLSELPSRFNIRTTSSVLSFEPKSATIPPKQTCDIKVTFAPRFRSINPKYQKDITFVNEDNEEDEQILEIKANITDQHRATFHSMFYSVQTAIGGNAIGGNFGHDHQSGALDFGNCVVQSRTVQKIKVLNESKEFGATLMFATASPEFQIYHANPLVVGHGSSPTDTLQENGLRSETSDLSEKSSFNDAVIGGTGMAAAGR